MYEESLRMPFLIRYPGAIKPKSVNKDIGAEHRFRPHVSGLCRAGDAQGDAGRSCRPLLEGHTPKDWRRSMYYRYWMHMADHGVPAHCGIATLLYKLVYCSGKPLGSAGALPTETAPEWELFDLEKDPHEMNSLYGDPEYAKIQKRLTEEMYRLQKECGDSKVGKIATLLLPGQGISLYGTRENTDTARRPLSASDGSRPSSTRP